MKVLVTGANGQLGRALFATAPSSAELISVSREMLDIGDAAAVDEYVAACAPNWIINAAAYTAVDKAESDAVAARRVNAEGARHLAAAAARAGARLLHVSTDFVFDGTQSSPYAVTDTPRPLGVYGQTKLEGERAVTESTAGNAVIVRTSWVYDASGRNFVTTMLRLMRERSELGVVQDQVGVPTWSHSLAACCWSLVQLDVQGATYHWTDAGVASWYDFAVAIMEEAVARGILAAPVSIRAIRTSEYPTPARRPAYSVLDRSAIESRGWKTAEHWRVSLRHALDALATGDGA